MSTPELHWFKSGHSSSAGDDCVETAAAPVSIDVRDSKAPEAPHLTVAPATWRRFVAHVSVR
ncbi:DUF397 domain-containing protein [Streptomyces mirabilis]|jgi:hypothetical protein|uniref:DUF397 domain-containing protein n=1 Tax=Streptomyces TaxID=1883 RepID=UPI0029AD5F5B|nr:DUF397 domain-containing protein [Streptomyces sp. AK02-04a]MDX3757664.1 DUF397 domain-containing protein [Streptomyces sp. AK02-04a]